MTFRLALLGLSLTLVLVGCADADGGITADGGEDPDAGEGPDAALGAGAIPDGGASPDGGATVDAGPTPDGGASPDGGSPADAAADADGGITPDGGATVDAGSVQGDGGASVELIPCADVPVLKQVRGGQEYVIDPSTPQDPAHGFFYSCTPCRQTPTECAAEVAGTATARLRLAFIVEIRDGSLPMPNGWAGSLRWTKGPPAINRAVVFHPGGDGGNADVYAPLEDKVEAEGARAIRVEWSDPDGTGGQDGVTYYGWMTRPSSAATNNHTLSKRPAAAFHWARNNLGGNGEGDWLFGGVGCSRGGEALFMARLWHRGDDYFDYMAIGGGPASTDMHRTCASAPVWGRCVETGSACQRNGDCGSGRCDNWNIRADDATTPLNAVVMDRGAAAQERNKINHVHATSACGDTASYEPFHESSFVDNPLDPGDWATPYPIDFFWNYSVLAENKFGDDLFDTFVSGREAFLRMSGPVTGRINPGYHCEDFGVQQTGDRDVFEHIRTGLNF